MSERAATKLLKEIFSKYSEANRTLKLSARLRIKQLKLQRNIEVLHYKTWPNRYKVN